MADCALMIVDMVSTYDFSDGDKLAANVERILDPLGDLIDRAREADAPIIYVNDSFGKWSSDRTKLVEDALQGQYRELVERITPDDDAMFVVKARHSVFYGTPIEHILNQAEIGHIVLTGVVTEQCILYSALDAHLRHITCTVPRDAVAHIHDDLAEASLKMMELNMGAEIVDAADVDF